MKNPAGMFPWHSEEVTLLLFHCPKIVISPYLNKKRFRVIVPHIPGEDNLITYGKALGERQELQGALIALPPVSKSLKGDLLCCTIFR